MKLIGYVSDDRYVALVDVAGEFQNEATGEITILRSSPRAHSLGGLAPGYYRVTLAGQAMDPPRAAFLPPPLPVV